MTQPQLLKELSTLAELTSSSPIHSSVHHRQLLHPVPPPPHEHQQVFLWQHPVGTAQPPDNADSFYSPLASRAASAQLLFGTVTPITPLLSGFPAPATRPLFSSVDSSSQKRFPSCCWSSLHMLFPPLRMSIPLFSSSHQSFKTLLRPGVVSILLC